MKKRGSLNLSINAIVVLILAITMLGLGLTFMRNIFGGATEEFEEMGGTIQKQMLDQMKESNKVVDLSNPIIDVEIGGNKQILLGLINNQQDDVDFTINTIECESISPGLECGVGQDVSVFYKTTATTILSGEGTVLPINIEIGTQATDGTCSCTVDIAVGDESKTTELIINVKV